MIQKEVEKEGEEVKKSLNYSIKDGAAASSMTSIIDTYMPAYAVALGATNQQMGLLTSLANLFAPMFQLVSLKNLRKGISRKKIVIIAVLLHALILIPILAIPLLFEKNRVIVLIVLFMLYAIFMHYPGPAWASWMGDLVPPKVRGEYFGRRNKIAGVTAILVTLTAGIILNRFTEDGVFIGFALIFIAATVFRLVSLYYLSLKYEPKFLLNGQIERFALVRFVKKMKNDNFAKFVLFVTLMSLSVNIAGPFFIVHMFKDLGWSYLTYTIVHLLAAASSFLAMVYWGKNIDRFGSLAVLRFTAPIISLLPLVWIIAKGNLYIISVIQILGGLAWAGFNLGVFTFINDSSTQEQRALFFTYFNILNGIGIFIGANLGGIISNYKISIMPNIFTYTLFTVMLISTILRLMVSAYFLPQIKEVKAVESGKPRFEVFGLDLSGLVNKVVIGIYIGKKNVREARWKKWFKGNILFFNRGKLLSAINIKNNNDINIIKAGESINVETISAAADPNIKNTENDNKVLEVEAKYKLITPSEKEVTTIEVSEPIKPSTNNEKAIES